MSREKEGSINLEMFCMRVLTNTHNVAAAGLRSPLGYEVLAVLREQPVFIQTYLLG